MCSLQSAVNNPTLRQVQEDWKILDRDDFSIDPSMRIVTNIANLEAEEMKALQAELVQPNIFVRLFPKRSLLYQLLGKYHRPPNDGGEFF